MAGAGKKRSPGRHSQPGDRKSVGEALIHDKRVPLISVTGSVRMGKHVSGAVASRLGKIILELGGNNATIVAPRADTFSMAGKFFPGASLTPGTMSSPAFAKPAQIYRLYMKKHLPLFSI